MKYQPRLDGIRGAAVLLVFTFHATHLLPGGWLGVDIFFVLSGYLITTILDAEIGRTGRIDFRNFYARRLLRLAPALLVTVAMCIPIMIIFPAERDYPTLGVVAGVLGYAANWMQVAHPTSLGPLTHTWSLAIEEQFYLVWPAALLLLRGSIGKRGRRSIYIIGSVMVILCVRAVLTLHGDPQSIWFATTSRADALLIGALLAGLKPTLRPRASSVILVSSAVLIAVSAFTMPEFSRVMLMGGLTVIALAAAGLIVGAGSSSLGRILEWRPLVGVGRVSYGIYLYHYPVFFIANRVHASGGVAWVLKICLTGTLVIASWALLEKPLLRLKSRLPSS